MSRLILGIAKSRNAVSTLESRVNVYEGREISPSSEGELLGLVQDADHHTNLENRLKSSASCMTLSPKLSSHLLEKLASIDSNERAMRMIAKSLLAPKTFTDHAALQADALKTALLTFRMKADSAAQSLQVGEADNSALGQVRIMEDSVIEHDARWISGFDMISSDITGRAVFKNRDTRLEVFTANRRKLEECFGVDLIYLNLAKKNIVMLQYKMLECENGDWVYRPDRQLDEEIERMRRFVSMTSNDSTDYRLNPDVFYLKCVKRDGRIANGGVIMPLAHFEAHRKEPCSIGPRGGLRISYKTLDGRYLRQDAFMELLRAGYIGAYSETTDQFRVLVEAILNDDRAVVGAIQSNAIDQ